MAYMEMREAEKQERRDVEGSSGHCTGITMAILGPHYASFRPNANCHLRALGRLALCGDIGVGIEIGPAVC